MFQKKAQLAQQNKTTSKPAASVTPAVKGQPERQSVTPEKNLNNTKDDKKSSGNVKK